MKTLVLYCDSRQSMAELADLLADMGLQVDPERHNNGRFHWAAQGRKEGVVIETYPANEDNLPGTWRLL